MIVVDTSALIAVVLNEATAPSCRHAMEHETELLVSAGTFAEALIVASGRNVDNELSDLVHGLDMEVVPVTRALAQRVGLAYKRWGRRFHPAGLNFGDCFAYALAESRGLPLLFVGNDFSRTDIVGALPSSL